jgi:hypothetical protein
MDMYEVVSNLVDLLRCGGMIFVLNSFNICYTSEIFQRTEKNKTQAHKLYYFLKRQKERENKGRDGNEEGESQRNSLIRIRK